MDASRQVRSENLIRTLSLFASRYAKAVSLETLTAGLPFENGIDTPNLLEFSQASTLFSRVAQRAGFKTTLIERDLSAILELHLPMIALLAHGESCIVEAFSEDRTQVKVIYATQKPLEEWVSVDTLAKEYLGYAFLLKRIVNYEEQINFVHHQHKKHWFWDTLKLSLPIYKDILLATLLVNLFVLASPLFTMSVYDRVIPNNAVETLLVFSLGVVLIYILDSFLKYFRAYMLELAAKKSDVVMSSIIFEKILDLKIEMHPKSVGSFASNIRDFDAIRSFLTNATMVTLIDLPFAIIFLLVIYYIGGAIVWIPIVMMVLIVAYALLIKKPLEKSIENTHQASAVKNGILIESLHNIETIKTQGMSGKIQWQWEESVGEIAKKSLYSRMLSSSVPTITGFFVQLTTVLIVVAGVFMIRDLELTMGGLIGIVILASRTVAPMGQVAALLTNYSDAKTAYEAIDKITTQPMERLANHHFIERSSFRGRIEFKNVTFVYPGSEVPALKEVSFVIESGEHVGFIGRIGSGKSTIEKLILKLYEPTSGSILVDGVDLSQIDPARLRKQIGYVSQDILLFRGTVKENILNRSPIANDEDLLEASRLSGVDEFVRQHPLGYDMPIGERGQGLSGGQKQSIGIARALISDAPLMLLDEPTNALDQISEARLMRHFKEAFRDKSLLLITQKMSLLAVTPRVIVMHEGRVFLDGEREEVLGKLKGKQNEA